MSKAIIRAVNQSLGGTKSDAFGRLRTADPVTLFDHQSQYDNGPLFWQEVTAGSGSATHVPAEAAVDLAVVSDGDIVIRQSRQYHRYQPGKSQFILMTFVMAAGATGLIQRVGYFDSDDGIFLELNGTSLRIVLRSSTSGSPVDTVVEQADWNGEESQVDITKAQIFFIDLEWLGVGSVRCGFVIDGVFRAVHQFNNANNLDKVYMKTANLPVRYEVRNSGADNSATLQAICCSVISEGGFETDRGIPNAAGNGTTVKAVNTSAVPVLSIRPKATFNSIVNRGQIVPQYVNAFAIGRPAYVQIVYNGTLTGANFQSVNSNSIVDVDTSATSISGGQVLDAFFVAADSQGAQVTSGVARAGILSRLPLTVNVSGSAESNISVVVQSFSATSSVSTDIFWQEYR